jgi:hypothetical protein
VIGDKWQEQKAPGDLGTEGPGDPSATFSVSVQNLSTERMRRRVDFLTSGEEKRRDLNVVQIRFNAWHYSDSSLWASIAVEIFERLHDPEPVDEQERERWLCDKGDGRRGEREQLLRQLDTYMEARAAAETEREALEERRRAALQKRDEVEVKSKEALGKVTLTDVATTLINHPQVTSGVQEITNKLGLTPAVDELSGLASELRTSGGYVANVWRLVANKTFTLASMATFFVLALVAAAFAVAGSQGWLPQTRMTRSGGTSWQTSRPSSRPTS